MPGFSAEARAASISFRQLRLFESVGRLLSCRRASEECNLSQPAVTQALSKLEQQVGVVLLERRARGSYLNEIGMILHRRVNRFSEQIEQALVELGIPGGQSAAPIVARRLSRSKLRSLLAIIEGKSLQEAAANLGLSEASLQRAAHELERNLQKQLYYRSADGMMVTQPGMEFGRKVKLATQEIEWGITEIEVALGRVNSKIVVGAMPFGGNVLLASVLDEFITAYPRVDVRIVNEDSPAMLRSLRNGAVDFVIGLLLKDISGDLESEALARTPYVIAGRRGHRLLKRGKITIEDLLSYSWVVGTPSSSRRACFDKLFEQFPGPRAPVVTSSIPVIRDLLARSDRLTLMTTYELRHEASALVEIPFQPIEPVPAIGITMRSNWRPTLLHADFIALLRNRVAELSKTPLMPKLAS
jgi:DNA-binding transcriptional LysR family regulator